jgi:hypothetical protein
MTRQLSGECRINNLNVATTTYSRIRENASDLRDEQETSVRVEEAALWYRVIDELARRYLGPESPIFMVYVQDWLANRLALQGASPELILNRMVDRTTEYGKYQLKGRPLTYRRNGRRRTVEAPTA